MDRVLEKPPCTEFGKLSLSTYLSVSLINDEKLLGCTVTGLTSAVMMHQGSQSMSFRKLSRLFSRTATLPGTNNYTTFEAIGR